MDLSIITPSRASKDQVFFLARLIRSITSQSIADNVTFELIVGLDKGVGIPSLSNSDELDIKFVHSNGTSQAKALNAAVNEAVGRYLFFIEDDDQWLEQFIELSLKTHDANDNAFVSSTQLEVDGNGEFLRINDFPTPSGWSISRELFEEIGPFNDDYKYHLDNEWLGRLNSKNIKRFHLLEQTAPLQIEYANDVRPLLAKVMRSSSVARHSLPYPLVLRLVHANSGMATISQNEDARKRSEFELEKLKLEFGHIPC
jgi:glycosyltransferase involved in cell wall biosynthesis